VQLASAVALLTVLTLWSGPAMPSGQSPDPQRQKPDAPAAFTVGVLRRDAVVTPFATFDGKTWTAQWPAELRLVDVPIALDTVPRKWWGKPGVLDQMTLWAGGQNRGIVRLQAPTMVPVMCSSRLGLRSDYVSPLPPPVPTEQSYPKEGLVVSGSTPVEGIPAVPSSSSEWAATALLLTEPFDAAETRAAAAFTDWKHPVPRKARQKVPIVLEALYKAPMDAAGWVVYRVQAVKRYAPGPSDGDCGLMSSASGWIGVGPDGKHWTQLGVRVTYCDRMDDMFTLPLGLIRARGRAYWVYQLSGLDREGFVVARPTPKGIETDVQYAAGSCPR
jgi:hypothetical protein